MCLDSQIGLQCISEPLVARCHGKDLTAACKCSVPGRTCAAGCCACPLKARRDKDRDAIDVNLKQKIIMNHLHMHYDPAIKLAFHCFPVNQRALLHYL